MDYIDYTTQNIGRVNQDTGVLSMEDMTLLESLILRRKLWLMRWNTRDRYYEYSEDIKAYLKGRDELASLIKEDNILKEEELVFGVRTNYTEGNDYDIHR